MAAAAAVAEQAASGSTAGAPHVLVVPYPAQGHMQPLLHLASLLAARGLRLTVAATPATAHLLAPLLAAHPSSVRPLTFSSAAGHDTSGPSSVGADFHAHAAALRAPLRDWLRSDSGHGHGHGRVTAVISDFFCGWTQPLAADAGVPRLVFAPSGLLATAATHSLFRRTPRPPPPEGDEGRRRGYAVSFPDLPGAPAFPWPQISRMYRSYAEADGAAGGGEHAEVIKDNFLWNLESAAFVCNTCHPLEGKYLDAQPLVDLAGKRVWAVGPVAPPTEETAADDDVTAWLDAFPDASVAYVSFGTMMVPPPAHAAALASALERSGTPFVWAAAAETALPDGFEARAVAARTGLVLRRWAPQVAALRHRATGCFVTHCGWNSVMEACAAGVPMLTWPMAADQFFNARLVVEEAHVAVAASWGGFGGVPDVEDLVRALDEIVGEGGAGVRARAKELAVMVAEAMGEGGSSRRELDGLVQELRELGSGR
ncbi:unnamed protein product [Urochloa decumbens]|uniref:Glycosyltransferase N-terminal domain-containing protein n=1 Tax=Urochloa decumbens TaxID=240449 RepID=A0ABC9DZ15_9POAL